MTGKHVDVLIVGAGVSGIGAACHLTRRCPGKSYAILERRDTIGGTWDLFNYPGIRSDSDMTTFGYRFRPWTDTRLLADGPAIRRYVVETAEEYGVDRHIRFGRAVVRASWSSDQRCWTVTAAVGDDGEVETYTCDFLLACTGYYDYDAGYRPQFAGEDRFTGTVVHPQHWPDDLDYAGKRVVVIGSGATAVTLVPAMAGDAEHVTMLQRSPSYVVALPAEDSLARLLRSVLPDSVVYPLTRARNIAMQRLMYVASRRIPDVMRNVVLAGVRRQLGGAVDPRHFEPRYNPWEERLCVVPDGDLFRALRSGDASVVTDQVDTFTPDGIRLVSGQHVDADVVVTATGLRLQLLGGAELEVDGTEIDVSEHLTYKGVLLGDVPNAALVFGYVNSSWTLKADIAGEYVCRLLDHMDANGHAVVAAPQRGVPWEDSSILSALRSGYVRRAEDELPRQGTRGPWRVTNDYLRDAPVLRYGRIDDGVLAFDDAAVAAVRRTPQAVSAP